MKGKEYFFGEGPRLVKACGVRVLGLGVRGEDLKFRHAGGGVSVLGLVFLNGTRFVSLKSGGFQLL